MKKVVATIAILLMPLFLMGDAYVKRRKRWKDWKFPP